MNVFELAAKLTLDSSDFDKGIGSAQSAAQKMAGTVGGAVKTGLKVAGAAITAATGAVAAFGASSVKTGMSFDSAMSQVAATMGKTASELQRETGSVDTSFGHFSGTLRDFAQYMGKNTKFSATEAAEALNYMALAGYKTQESMEMLPNVLNLAAAGNMDLALASDMVTDTQTAFGISMERTSQMVDEMAKASSTGNTSVQQLGEAFLTVGGLAQELNGGMVKLADGTQKPVDGVQELEIALTAMANAGVKGSEAGTHMRNMLLKLASPTSDGTKQLKKLGVEVFDTEGNMRSLSDVFGDLNGKLGELTQEQKIQAISDLFNTRDLASAEALLNAVGQDWDEIGEAILNAEGAAAKMANTQLDNLAGDVTIFKSALEGAQIAISTMVSGPLRDFVKLATEGVTAFGDMFRQVDASQYLDEMGRMSEAGAREYERARMAAEKNAETARQTVFDTIKKGVSMVVDLVPELIKAGGELLSALGQGIMENAQEIIFAAYDIVEMLFDSMLEATSSDSPSTIMEILNMIVGGFTENYLQLIDVGMQIIENVINGIIEGLPELIGHITDLVLHIGEVIIEHAPELIKSAFELILQLALGIAQALPELIPTIVDVVLTIVEALIDNIDLLIDAAIALMTGLAEGIINALPILIEKAPEIITKLVSAIIDNIPKLAEAAGEIISGLMMAILENLPRIIESGVEINMALVTGIVSAVGELIDAGATIIDSIWEGVKSLDVVQWGKDLISGFIDGIHGGLDAVGEIAGGIAGKIKAFIGFSEPEEGPLADFHTYAPDMIDLFANGILENGDIITSALSSILTGAMEAIQQFGTTIQTIGTNIMTMFHDAIVNSGGNILQAFQTIITNVFTAVQDFGARLANFLTESGVKNLAIIIKWLTEVPIKFVKYITEAVNKFMDVLRQLPSKVASVLSEIIKKITEFATNMKNKAVEAAKGFADSLINGVKDLPSKFGEVGSNIVNGLWEGIQSGWSWLTDAVSNLANSLLGGVKSLLGISSPSKKFMWVGQMVDAGFAKGLEDYSYLVDDAMAALEPTIDVGGAYSVNGMNGTTERGPVTINVYPSAGMDEKALAQDISYYLANEHARTRAVWRPQYAG